MENNITGKVIETRHAGTSNMGNPAYWVTIETDSGDVVTLRTMSNTMLAYGITNPEYRASRHVFTLTRAGRIHGARIAA